MKCCVAGGIVEIHGEDGKQVPGEFEVALHCGPV